MDFEDRATKTEQFSPTVTKLSKIQKNINVVRGDDDGDDGDDDDGDGDDDVDAMLFCLELRCYGQVNE